MSLPEAKFLVVIGTKVLGVFLLAIHSHLYYGFGLKRICYVKTEYGNLNSENSQDYAQKPQ
jgi:hypothetical protein